MGRGRLSKPKRLAEKLLLLRRTLGLSQSELIRQMRLTDELLREEVSDFERGKRVPPLNVLLAYAQAANLYVDTLIDDRLDLPTKLPAPKKTAGTKVR